MSKKKGKLSSTTKFWITYLYGNYMEIIYKTNLIEAERQIHYIETLYLSTNLHEHIEGNYTEIDKHNIGLSKIYEYVANSNALFLGVSYGREWYQFDHFKLGILDDYDKMVKSNWYSLVVQYSQSYMFGLKNIDDLFIPFGTDKSKYKITRVDVTNIYKSKIDYLQDNYKVITKYRTENVFKKEDRVLTRYFGSRKSGNMVRWYNKEEELKSKVDYAKIEALSEYFGSIEDLYTIELELHRKYLKEVLGIENLSDISKAFDAFKDIVGGLRLYEDTEENRNRIINKNYNEIATLRFSSYSPYDRIKTPRNRGSITYFVEDFHRKFKRLSEAIEIDDVKKLRILNYFARVMYPNDDISVSIHFDAFKDIRIYEAKLKEVTISNSC